MEKFSKRSLKLKPSELQDFFKKAKSLQGVLSLGVGEPYNNTPPFVKEEGHKAIRHNKTGYIPASGSLEAKKILANKYGVRPENVIISSGAKAVIGAVLWTIIDNGDRVLAPAPYYPLFAQVPESCGAKLVLIDTKKDNFLLKSEAVERAIKENRSCPKALIINSPNNPTGAVYEKEELKKIADLSRKFGFIIISDECYNNFSPDPKFTFIDLSSKAVIVNSCSKTYAMPGWRIGWGIMPEELAYRVNLFLENFFGCPNAIAEQAAIKALAGPGIGDYSKQRELARLWLEKMNIPFMPSMGGFYYFPDFSEFINPAKGIDSGVALANYILEKALVAVTPGIDFGENYGNHLRISYCVEEKTLDKALKKIKDVLEKLK